MRSPRQRSLIRLAALVVLALALTGGVIVVVHQSERTRVCTIEGFHEVRAARSQSYMVVQTAECNDIRATLRAQTQIVNPDCPYDIARVGGRYRMTTVGFEPIFWPLEQRLVGTMVLVKEAPGAVCLSTS